MSRDEAAEPRFVERHLCTADTPWIGGRTVHPDAIFLGRVNHDGWTCKVYRCPHCNSTLHEEIPG